MIIHESIHQLEYKEIIKTSESMCFLGINYNFINNNINFEKCVGGILDAHYKFMPINQVEVDKALIIDKTSEIYAYAVQFLFLLVLSPLLVLLFIKLWERK